ncbi:MAG TPA: hypothetical protein VHV75_03955 [Solirubrobacteraceae bacterium]|nr:hypothetical protein [Solirubrobacteraceae bacterium]
MFRRLGRILHSDCLVALWVKALAGRSDPVDAFPCEHAVHLLEDRAKPLAARLVHLHVHGALHAVGDVQPVSDDRVLGRRHPHLHLPRSSLAVVVQVGEGPLVAVLYLLQLGGEIPVVGRGLVGGGGGLRVTLG